MNFIAPPGTSGRFLAVGIATGENTVPVAVDLGSEIRGLTVRAYAIGSDGTIIDHCAIARRTGAGLDWQMTGSNLTFDSDNVLSFEVPEVPGVSWAASLALEFSE